MASTSARIRITRVVRPNEVASQVAPHMTQLGNAVGRRMQRLVPKKSWRLHDSITKPETAISGAVVTTTLGFGGRVNGVDVDYGLMVERGTSKMAAQPFARPALLQSRSGDLDSSVTMSGPHGSPGEGRARARAARRIGGAS